MPEDCQGEAAEQREATLGSDPGSSSDWPNVFSYVSSCLYFSEGKMEMPSSYFTLSLAVSVQIKEEMFG